jgi:hypothetical protein
MWKSDIFKLMLINLNIIPQIVTFIFLLGPQNENLSLFKEALLVKKVTFILGQYSTCERCSDRWHQMYATGDIHAVDRWHQMYATGDIHAVKNEFTSSFALAAMSALQPINMFYMEDGTLVCIYFGRQCFCL